MPENTENRVQNVGASLFSSLFGGGTEVGATQASTAWAAGLQALLAPTKDVVLAATSLGETLKKAENFQKELEIKYPSEVYTTVALNHGNGNVHLVQRYVEQAANFISVNAECYNKVSRAAVNIGIGYGDLILGVKDSRMKESQQLVGIITSGSFFFVKSHCVVCKSNI